MKVLTETVCRDEVLRRLARLRPDSRRRWGRMTPHQAVCHLRDAFLMGRPEAPVSDANVRYRTVIKWIALYAPVRWPTGIATRPEIDQAGGGGTPPADFAEDVASLASLVEAVSRDPGFFSGRRHPIFGPLSERAWMRWAWLHLDHHLRQFGE